MTFILGLTGGIGSGKTTASNWFMAHGIDVVDADVIARDVVSVGQPALQHIAQQFGEQYLLENGELNRALLRRHIFEHPEARQQLEQITHPIIFAAIKKQLKQASSPYTILSSPLLFETNQHTLCHRTLLIDVSEQTQLQRTTQRDGVSSLQIQQIIAAQMPRNTKQQLASDIVLNEGTANHLYLQLMPLHYLYLSLAQ